MRNQKYVIKGLLQRLFITINTFRANDLVTYASAGAYSFLLSVFPILLMVLVILLRFLNTSPELIRSFIASNEVFFESLKISSFLDSILAIKSVSFFEIVIGISVILMARRFFASIQQGIKIIYKKRGLGKALKENLVVLAGEACLVILLVLLTILILAGKAFMSSDVPARILTPFIFGVLKMIFRFAPLIILCTFVFFVYYFAPPTRPSFRHSFLAACLCTLSLTVTQLIFNVFVNMTSYNLVYGILSNLIVILLQVYMFFFLFLFFAQFLYVSQFFESFLFSRIYLLPGYHEKKLLKQLERILFVKPTRFYTPYAIEKKAGEIIFSQGDLSTELYYIWQGTVHLDMPNQMMELDRGRIFGEFASIVGGTRTATATAYTDVILLKIPAHIFRETIEVDAEMSRKTLLMISDYVKKMNAEVLSP